MMEYPCQACGSCCKNIGQSIEDAKAMIASGQEMTALQKAFIDCMVLFPHKRDETGRCEKLGNDNRCTVYLKRPFVCNVKRVFKHLFSKTTTWKKYKTANLSACEKHRSKAR
jgi:Fe-S-cluster containining protein